MPRLAQTSKPTCDDGEILIRVLASSVNPVDRLVGLGCFRAMQPYHLPAVLGRDVSGIVEEIGAGVSRFAPGDRVFGFLKRKYAGDGAFAEYVACPADRFVTATPDGLPTRDGGMIGVAGVTARACLDAVGLTGDDTILVTGAARGAGTFIVQMEAAAGARVLATAPSGTQTDLLGDLSAEHVLDWTAGPIDAELRDLAPKDLDRVAAAVLAGSVRPVVSATFDLDDIACLDRSITGKVALRISPET